jgi:hypothetical protein
MTTPNQQLVPVKEEAPVPQPEMDTFYTLLRLLVGGAIVGTDELIRRSKAWQQEISQATADKMVIAPFADVERNRLRHMVIGLLFETPGTINSGISAVGQASEAATDWASKLLRPIVRNPLVRPAKRRYDKLVAQGNAVVGSWMERGRSEELVSRAMAEQAIAEIFDEVLDEVIAELAQKPEVRDLLQQQSIGVADEMMGEVRHRAASADAILERLARAMLRRSSREEVVELSGQAQSSPPATEKK